MAVVGTCVTICCSSKVVSDSVCTKYCTAVSDLVTYNELFVVAQLLVQVEPKKQNTARGDCEECVHLHSAYTETMEVSVGENTQVIVVQNLSKITSFAQLLRCARCLLHAGFCAKQLLQAFANRVTLPER